MTTKTDRIERAARAILATVPAGYGMTEEEALAYAAVALGSAFPELFADPPTAWLAPPEATEGMRNAAIIALPADEIEVEIHEALSGHYRAMRDAHLKEQGE